MKLVLYISIFLTLISLSNTGSEKGNSNPVDLGINATETAIIKIDTVKIANFNIELISWLNYYKKYNIKLENFIFVKQNKLPEISTKVDTFNLANNLHTQFNKYSPDSTVLLDLASYNITLELNKKNELVSYGGAPDSEVSINDLNNKFWKRILFVGNLDKIEDGFWINNNQFLIVGQFNEYGYNDFKPEIWFIDLEKNIIQFFEYNEYIKSFKCDYLEKYKYKNVKMK